MNLVERQFLVFWLAWAILIDMTIELGEALCNLSWLTVRHDLVICDGSVYRQPPLHYA